MPFLPTRRTLLLATLALLTLPVARAQNPTETLTLTLLHTNDLHGHVLPHIYAEEGSPAGKGERVRGGIARIATLSKALKRGIKNPTLLVDTGDTATRGPLVNAYEGIADVEAMNAAGYDLGTLGNNEFKLKDGYEDVDNLGAQAGLLKVLRRSQFPRVCANAFSETGGFLPGVQPFVVREISGVRIGFLGLTALRSGSYPQTKGWTISDPIDAAKKWIPIARKECDVLIALTHVGVDDDKKMSRSDHGNRCRGRWETHIPFCTSRKRQKTPTECMVPIVQSGEFGVNLGRFDLRFVKYNNKWSLAEYKEVLLPITEKIKEDKTVKSIANEYAGPLQQEIVATIPGNLIGKTPDERTKLTAQATMEGIRRGIGADVGITLPGAGSFNVFRAPNVSRYDLQAVWPFKNHAATVTMFGSELAALKAKFPTLVIAADFTTPEPGKTYTVAVIDFVATGTLKIPAEKVQNATRNMRDVFIEGWKRK